ncbi:MULTISPECIES: hypothetical protein [Novosphingobium]|nr:hypothetical protein [Novosphingobium percolationis]
MPEPTQGLKARLRAWREEGAIEALFVTAVISSSFVNAVSALLR